MTLDRYERDIRSVLAVIGEHREAAQEDERKNVSGLSVWSTWLTGIGAAIMFGSIVGKSAGLNKLVIIVFSVWVF
jgi:hypothetical protein